MPRLCVQDLSLFTHPLTKQPASCSRPSNFFRTRPCLSHHLPDPDPPPNAHAHKLIGGPTYSPLSLLLPMTTTSVFTVTGFFALTSGNRDNDQHRACYESALVCIKPPPIQAKIFTYNPSGGAFLPDKTIAFILGKVFYPPPADCRPAIIDAIDLAPFPGDPSNRNYMKNIPNFRHPAITAQGTVSAPETLDNGQVEFLLTVQDYVGGSLKTSTITSVSIHRVLSLLTMPSSCRIDKPSTRWKNVPTPSRNSQVIVIGICLENTPEDRLCVDVRSLNLPAAAPALPLCSSTTTDDPAESDGMITAHAPPRRPPQKRPSTTIARSDTVNASQSAPSLLFSSQTNFYMVHLLTVTIKNCPLQHRLCPKQMKTQTQTPIPACPLGEKASAKPRAKRFNRRLRILQKNVSKSASLLRFVYLYAHQ